MQHLTYLLRQRDINQSYHMKKNIVMLMAAVIAVCGLTLGLVSSFGLNAKSKVKKENAVTASSGLVTRDFNLSAFEKIEVGGNFNVEFVQGAQKSVTVTGPQYEMDHLTIEVKGSKLEIGFDDEYYKNDKTFNGKNNKRSKSPVTVKMSAPSVSLIDMSLSASFKASTLRHGGQLKLEASTSGKINLESVQCGSLSADADTSGSIKIDEVQTSDADLDADTSGSVYAKSLSSVKVKVDADTSGSIKVDYLTGSKVVGSADTSGKITLKGVVSTVSFTADTSGYVDAGELRAENATVRADTNGKIKYCARHTNAGSTSLINTYKAD